MLPYTANTHKNTVLQEVQKRLVAKPVIFGLIQHLKMKAFLAVDIVVMEELSTAIQKHDLTPEAPLPPIS